MPVELRTGLLHVTGTELALDATRKCGLSFVSHGHSDHIGRHARTLATAPTLRFMAHRLGRLADPVPLAYGEPFQLGRHTLELFPAGHILGSAQLRVTRPDGHRVCYTGDLNTVPSLTAEPHQVVACDTLVIEATFGHPRYAFPPKDAVLDHVEAWVRFQLASGKTPVLLGYPLGKSQEAMKFLADRGFPLAAHESIYAVAQLYQEFGVSFGDLRELRAPAREGEVVFVPPHVARRGGLAPIYPRATAVLTGWALDAGAADRYGAQVAFPVSDHADFPSLMAYAKASGAREVLTHHGFNEELASALRAAGIEARPVGQARQLALL